MRYGKAIVLALSVAAAAAHTAPPSNPQGGWSGSNARLLVNSNGGTYTCTYAMSWSTTDGKNHSSSGQTDVSGTGTNNVVVEGNAGVNVVPGSVRVNRWNCLPKR